MPPRWSKRELNLLREIFPHKKDKEVADIIGRPLQATRCKARRLDLYKTERFIGHLRRETSKNIASGPHRHKFKKGGDSTIFCETGEDHPNYISDRSQIKGPRRRQDRFSPAMMRRTRATQNDKCNLCDKLLYRSGEFDHIKPVCISGTASIDNCQLLCSNCHSMKSHSDQQVSNNYLDLSKLQEIYS